MRMLAGLFLSATLLAASSSVAKWKPEYAQLPPDVRDWYEKAELTPAAQKRFGFKSCCAHSDVVKTQFRVNKADGVKYPVDEWWWLNGSVYERVPDDIIWWDKTAPSGLPTLFAVQGKPTCFFPPEGGI